MATSSASVRYFDLVREMKDAVRRIEDITEALWGTGVNRSTVSELNQKIYGRWKPGATGRSKATTRMYF